MNNVINWFEIPVSDMARAVAFYESVMGVTLRREVMEGAELAVFPHRDEQTGGALAKFEHITPSSQGCIIYLHTDDLRTTLKNVAAKGGECVFGPLELPDGIGAIALFTDSEGNRIGLHQPA
ncbi:VOC family protein [Pluralibacter sp.]|uniref:VOC family protein n=1 Tax=Pluralibacter sp. TaxID=1920032 RepID=UPI0025E70F5F|nr:VOC family protein [Pluralibacter sp.]MBV8041468.1 VOC family protein [Pluralibacter sp.]